MNAKLELKSLPARLLFFILILAVCASMVWVVVNHFIAGTLADERIVVERERMALTVGSFPNSPRLHARYAQAELLSIDRDLGRAAAAASRATKLSPYNYRYQLLLGSIEELRGDRDAAERTLRKAVELAPANPETHWQLANVLLRQKKLDESLPEFQLAASARRGILPATLDLVWRASVGSVAAVEAVTGDDTRSQIALAQFLLVQARSADAVRVFSRIDREARLAAPESGSMLDALINAGALSTARELWVGLVGDAGDNQPVGVRESGTMLVWNGGFESDVLKGFAQFDWNLSRSDYARLSFDNSAAHGGARSLRLDFVGKDTTRLDNEIKQTVVLAPGIKYRLEYWVKTEKFSAPEGPRVVLTEVKSGAVAARSVPIASGTADWQRSSVEFVAPAQSDRGVTISIKRIPEFSYDEPTRGTVWFDDFRITKL